MKAFDIRITTEEEPEANAIIEIGLETANNDAAASLFRPLNVLVYDRDSLIAGVLAHTVEATLVLRNIWVDAACRSQGVARSILGKLENEAQGRGCKAAYVDVMSYQSPDFFEKVGYNEVNRIDGFQMDHDRIFMRKELT